jgi:peptidyl-prolyl cis-trans isomerase B (cyclophilin B)
MYQKKLLIGSIALSSLLFSACTGPTPPQQDLKLNLDGRPIATNSAQANPTIAKGEPMKTLADFKKIEATQVTITTNKGEIIFEIYTDKVPLTAQNFLNLAESGFYDGIIFHRVIPGFMAQVGDPLTKDPSQEAWWGTGGPGYAIADEFDPTLKHDGPGIVSMANSGPNSGGSQIFITYEATPHLDGRHAVFGKVTSGMEVLEQITIGDKIEKVSFK